MLRWHAVESTGLPPHIVKAARVQGGWLVRYGESVTFVPRLPWWKRRLSSDPSLDEE